MHQLSIDVETFSSADLPKTGVYKYAESPDFEILLFGYSVDGSPVKVIDLACGEQIPQDVLAMLTDPDTVKWAFNAAYERVCLSRFLKLPTGTYLPPEQWRCSMVWSAYLGLPLSLAGVGSVLKLEKQKLEEGKDLIRYFSMPCHPTKANGGRTRNRPADAPDKWALYKQYNLRDVETEIGIKEKLSKFPVPDFVWDEYHLDQEINDRGIRIDMGVVENAIRMDECSKAELTHQMHKLTALENPNSVAQMKEWLAEHGTIIESLGKKEVAALLKDADPELAEVLILRQQLAKSSVRKYQAMQNCVCADGRARGMFMFYGANRTGRFCLTGDHEVLTEEGWARLDQWQGGRIACWHAGSGQIAFQHAEQVSFDYSGQMYSFTDGRIDQCSTPDHKMWAKAQGDAEWKAMTVEEMSKVCPSIPLSGYKCCKGCTNGDRLRVLIMTQAEGFYAADGGVRYHLGIQRKIEGCEYLLRKAGIPFVTHTNGGTTRIEIPAKAVPFWLREFQTFGFRVFDEDPDVFFDELKKWSSYYPVTNRIRYTTCTRQNADIVQALAHMSGRTATMRVKHHDATKANSHDIYVVDICLTPGRAHEIREKPTVSDLSGKVYCAVTQTGYFLVRRNGRVWVTGNSGRLVQLQNLPQNHMEDLEEARSLVRSGNYDVLHMLYDSVPDVLSELIRTAFVPYEGGKFIVSDFSAIEARVIAWLAGEEWRMELFRKGGDIYCQSASQMFKVPVEKHGVNGHLRAKGKVAELSCIAENSPVLTDRGLVPIQNVTTNMRVWDGENWVHHDGVVYRGEREVMTYGGLTATPDHYVWVEGKPEPVQLGFVAASGAHLIQTGDGGQEGNALSPNRTARVYDIRNAGPHHRFTVSGKLVHNCGYGGSVGALKAMGALDMGLKEEELKPLVDAWRSANPNIVKLWWDVDAAVKETVETKKATETHGLKFTYESGFMFIELPSGRRLAYVKPRLDVNKFGGDAVTYEGIGATKKWERLESYGPKFVENCIAAGTLVMTGRGLVPIEQITLEDTIWDGEEWVRHEGVIAKGCQPTVSVNGIHMTAEHKILTTKGWMECAEAGEGSYWESVLLPGSNSGSSGLLPTDLVAVSETQLTEPVYDILNCGPRHRFVVWDRSRKPRIVSNCTQAIARDVLCYAMNTLRDCFICGHVHDELIIEADPSVSLESICERMGRTPPWAKGLVLRADGYETNFYKKD